MKRVREDGRYYWLSQIGGWTLYSLMLSTWNYLINGFDLNVVVQLFFVVIILGISLSHLYRGFIRSSSWLNMSLGRLIPRVILASILFGIIYSLVFASLLDLFFPKVQPILTGDYIDLLTIMANWVILFLLWSAGYIAYKFLGNYKTEEIKNLRLESSQREMELSVLKSQLNPHFIFNAMNSIRALVDEDPKQAKQAVTKLSNILRGSLMIQRRNMVTVKEEMSLVQDHLDLEQIRFEERLNVSYDIDSGLMEQKIPPMMIQTLVENAVKHGIARTQSGGEVVITIKDMGSSMKVEVKNTGFYTALKINGTGIGLKNMERRLNLLYNGHASFNIRNSSRDSVTTTLTVPKTKEI